MLEPPIQSELHGKKWKSPVETTQFDPNPYASPIGAGDTRQAEWYLASACRYFKGIGGTAVVYLICVIPFSLYELFADESPRMGELIGAPTMMVAMLLFFGAMIHTAMRLPNDFERLYGRARWLGILAGAFGFPILTIPAFIGVCRLSKYRTLISGAMDGPVKDAKGPAKQ
jgi:hypothetical protein